MKTLSLLLVALVLAPACGSREERVAEARARFEVAVAARDPVSALAAIDDLREALPDTPETMIELAERLRLAGEPNRALWLLQEAAQRHPDRVDLQIGVARAALGVGEAAGALAALARVETEDSGHASAAFQLRARAERQLGDLEAALATLERAEASFPGDLQLLAARVGMLVNEGQDRRALDVVTKVRARDDLTEDWRGWLERTEAVLRMTLGETEAALRLFESLTSADPGDVESWRGRMSTLLAAKRADEAAELLASALEARPDVGGLYELLVRVELVRADPEAAEAALRAWMERAPDADAAQQLAHFLFSAGRASEGAALLTDAVARFPGVVDLEYLHVAMRLSAGNVAEAQQQFELFERRYPRDPRTEYLRARFELARGEAAAAAERLRAVVPRMDRSDVQHWLGLALELSGDHAAAETPYGRAVNRNPHQIPSYLGLLRVLERRGAWETAESYALVLLRYDPGNRQALESLARARMQLGAPEDAERVLRAFVESTPDHPAPTVALSAALRSQGRLEESLALLDEAAERFGGDPDFQSERALVLGLLGRGDEGLAVLDGVGATASHASLHRARAFLLLAADRDAEGFAEVEKALALEPTNTSVLRLAGDYLMGRGDFAGAARAYERLAEQPAWEADGFYRLGRARSRAGDAAGAIAAYRRAVAADADAVAPRNDLALALAEAGELSEAVMVAQAAYARAETSPVVMDTLGSLYLRAGRVERAVALLEKAREVDPEAVETRFHLAVAYGELGRSDEARALLSGLRASLDDGHGLHARVDAAEAALP